jgi:uncharacterized protein YebE (UPF0316 family)
MNPRVLPCVFCVAIAVFSLTTLCAAQETPAAEPSSFDQSPFIVGTSIPLPIAAAWLPVFIFVARICDVSVGTVRLICIARGQRVFAIGLAFAEITIWLLAVACVIMHLHNWLNMLAYICGFTVGNAVGLWIDQRLALGAETVMLISRTRGQEIAARLREADVRLTTIRGSGRDGDVEICLAIVPRRQTPSVIALAMDVDPEVLTTVEDVRHTSIKHAGAGFPGKIPLGLPGGLFPRRNGPRRDPPGRGPVRQAA